MRLTTITALSLIILAGCNNHSEIRLQAVYNTLVTSNSIIADENDMIKTRLAQKLQDPQTMTKAQIWHPKAMAVFTATKNTIQLIDSMQMGKTRQDFANASTRLSRLLVGIKDTINQSLRAENFPENPYVASIAETKRREFTQTLLKDICFDSTHSSFVDNHTAAYFKDGSLLEAKLMTERIRNEVLAATRSVLLFYDQNTTVAYHGFEVFSTVLTKNADNLSAGQELIVTAGMGSFSTAMRPVFTIAGKNIEPGNDGLVSYSLIIHQPPGEYKIPVSVKYTAPDGRVLVKENVVRYKVISNSK